MNQCGRPSPRTQKYRNVEALQNQVTGQHKLSKVHPICSYCFIWPFAHYSAPGLNLLQPEQILTSQLTLLGSFCVVYVFDGSEILAYALKHISKWIFLHWLSGD